MSQPTKIVKNTNVPDFRLAAGSSVCRPERLSLKAAEDETFTVDLDLKYTPKDAADAGVIEGFLPGARAIWEANEALLARSEEGVKTTLRNKAGAISEIGWFLTIGTLDVADPRAVNGRAVEILSLGYSSNGETHGELTVRARIEFLPRAAWMGLLDLVVKRVDIQTEWGRAQGALPFGAKSIEVGQIATGTHGGTAFCGRLTRLFVNQTGEAAVIQELDGEEEIVPLGAISQTVDVRVPGATNALTVRLDRYIGTLRARGALGSWAELLRVAALAPPTAGGAPGALVVDDALIDAALRAPTVGAA